MNSINYLVRTLIIYTLLCSALPLCLQAQSTTSPTLFKGPRQHWQWDLGKTFFNYTYQSISPAKSYELVGTTIDFVGLRLDQRVLALGIDFVAAGPSEYDYYPNRLDEVYRLRNMGNFFMRYEQLFQPNKKLFFSVPIKIGYGGNTYEYLQFTPDRAYMGTISEQFFLAGIGGQAMVRLFQNVSLGAGIHYRYVWTRPEGDRPRYGQNNYFSQVFLRFELPPRLKQTTTTQWDE